MYNLGKSRVVCRFHFFASDFAPDQLSSDSGKLASFPRETREKLNRGAPNLSVSPGRRTAARRRLLCAKIRPRGSRLGGGSRGVPVLVPVRAHQCLGVVRGSSVVNSFSPVLVPVRASPVPSAVHGNFVVKFFLCQCRAREF